MRRTSSLESERICFSDGEVLYGQELKIGGKHLEYLQRRNQQMLKAEFQGGLIQVQSPKSASGSISPQRGNLSQ